MLGKFVYSVTMETKFHQIFICFALDVLVRRAGHVRLQGGNCHKTWEATTKMLCHTSVAYTLFPLLKFEMLPAFQIPQFSIKLLVIMDFTQDKHCK